MPYATLEQARAYRERTIEAKRLYDLKYRASTREVKREHNSRYYQEHKDSIHRYRRARRETTPSFRLADALRSRLRTALHGKQKSGSAVEDLGCSIPEFRLYIENQFEEGMSWDNYGEVWELDHVIPLNQFDLSNRMELLEACNWLNIRPLSCEDNRSRPRQILGVVI